MNSLSTTETESLERAADEPMLDQTQDWARVNSGSGNLAGLKTVADKLANAFAPLPGELALRDPIPSEIVRGDGSVEMRETGKNLHLKVRPDAPVQVLLTGHMDTVFAADHSFQSETFLDDDTLNAPGAADMKGGLAIILASLSALEGIEAWQNVGYDVLINADEETGSLSSALVAATSSAGNLSNSRAGPRPLDFNVSLYGMQVPP